MSYDLTCSVHKGTCASAHLGHNRRTIYVPHADSSRKHLNVCYVDMSVEDAYHYLFDKAVEEYNKGKKPSRQIKDYYRHILIQYQKGQEKLQEAISRGASKAEQRRIKSRYPKIYNEVIVTVGNSKVYDGIFSSTGEKADTTAEILDKYMKGFQKRNPNLFVFNAHMHRDETGSNHLHIDYIPWTDLPGRGVPTRVSENGAFMQQGLTTGKYGDYGTVKFQEQERKAIAEISKEFDINIVDGRCSRKHLTKEAYILNQEKEELSNASKLIDSEAEALLEEQDKFVAFVQSSDLAPSYVQHKEKQKLESIVEEYEESQKRAHIIIASAWKEFNDGTADYFSDYRKLKGELYDELQLARREAWQSKKKLKRYLYQIAYTNDCFIVKLFKLVVAFFVAMNADQAERKVRQLQEQNDEIKKVAKQIVTDSQKVGEELRKGELAEIEKALSLYDQLLLEARDELQMISKRQGCVHENRER